MKRDISTYAQTDPALIASTCSVAHVTNLLSDMRDDLIEQDAQAGRQAARITEMEEQLADAEARMDAMEADLAQARLLLVAIDENICMSSNPLTITTGRIVELLRDPASNPWAALMRAGKEGGE